MSKVVGRELLECGRKKKTLLCQVHTGYHGGKLYEKKVSKQR